MQKALPQSLPPGCSTPSRRGQRRFTQHLALGVLASLAAGWIGSAQASDKLYNFDPPNGDPYKNGFVLFGSNTNGWQTNYGFSGLTNDGFLEITPALGGQTLGILFPLDYFTNADNSLTALPLKGFELDVDIRTGNAVGNNGRPADGFSISFASSQDPVVFWGKQGNFRGWAGGDGVPEALQPVTYNYATGVGVMDPATCTAGTAENGTKTGISVQFDTWAGNTIVDQNGQVPAAGNDNVGWRVHYNGKMIDRILAQPPSGPLPTGTSPDPGGADANGIAVCPAPGAPADFTQPTNCVAAILADTNSIQTGPYSVDDDGLHNGSFTNLGWAHLSVILTTNNPHVLTVTYKGRALVDNVTLTNFTPYVGQLVMGGRTGGANENRDIDNVHIITYPSVQSVFGGISSLSSYLNDFSLLLNNVGPAKVTKINSLTLDGVEISTNAATTITLGDPNSTIKYAPPAYFASQTTHALVLTWTDATGNTQTIDSGFSTLPWSYLPASLSLPVGSVDTNQTGFLVKASQVASGQPNNMYWTDEQLMGLRGTNYIDFTTLTTTNGEVPLGNSGQMVDYDNGVGSDGQFPGSSSFGDFGVPGGSLIVDDNMALAFTTYLYFPTPGTYVMGFNSDDSSRVTMARNSHDLLGTEIPGLHAEGGRGIGSLQNVGAIIVTNAGYYGFRLLYENGGGGAGVEWYFTSTPAGTTNVLINDLNQNPQYAVRAFQVSSAAPPYVSYAEPPLDDDLVPANATIQYKISDAGTTVVPGSVALKINGAVQSPALTTGGGVTSLSLPAPATLWPVGTNNIELSFKDSAGATNDYRYSFVVPAYATLDPSQSVPLGSQDATKPGFVLTTTHLLLHAASYTGSQGTPNQSDVANAEIAGLFYPTYGVNGSTAPGPSPWPGVIDFAINGSAGDFTNNYPLPGVGTNSDNTTDNIAAYFQFWLAFPTAGFYRMGVSSDDGYRVSEGFDHIRQVLHVSGTGINKDVGAVVSTTVDGNGGYGIVPPVTPIVAPVMVANSNTVMSSLSGKIAVFDRGLFGFGSEDLCVIAQTNGAVGFIIIDTPANGFPYRPSGTLTNPITIPVLAVSGYNGDRDFWITNANLTATIGASQAIELGGADYGKGMGWVDFSVIVPSAGLYPLNVIYYNGGGGAGIEFASISPVDGSRTLINDTSNPNALLAYQAVTATAKPTVSIGKLGNTLTITFTGKLQSSSTVNGGYTDVAGATNPYTVPNTTGAQFYRTH